MMIYAFRVVFQTGVVCDLVCFLKCLALKNLFLSLYFNDAESISITTEMELAANTVIHRESALC